MGKGIKTAFACLVAINSIAASAMEATGSIRIRYEHSASLQSDDFIRDGDAAHSIVSVRPDVSLYMPGGQWELRAAPNISYDAAYSRESIYDGTDAEDASTDVDWRDTYIGYRGTGNFIRAGRQVVSWGTMDGLRLANRINPINLERYLVPYLYDYEEGVEHVSAISWESLGSQGALQVVVVPEYRKSALPPKSNRFSPYYAYRNFAIAADDKPGATEAEYGFRYQHLLGNNEWSFYFWKGYPDVPALKAGLDQEGEIAELAYHYARESYLGLSYSGVWGYKVVRAEVGVLRDSAFKMDVAHAGTPESIELFNARGGLLSGNRYLAAMGVETELWSPATRLILQYYHEQREELGFPLYTERRQNALTLAFTQPLGDYDRYELRLDGQYWLHDHSHLVRAGFTDRFAQNWLWNLELLQLRGEPQTNFGRYGHVQYTFRLQYEM